MPRLFAILIPNAIILKLLDFLLRLLHPAGTVQRNLVPRVFVNFIRQLHS